MGRYGAFKKVVQGRIEKFGSKNLETVLKGSPYKTPGPVPLDAILSNFSDTTETISLEKIKKEYLECQKLLRQRVLTEEKESPSITPASASMYVHTSMTDLILSDLETTQGTEKDFRFLLQTMEEYEVYLWLAHKLKLKKANLLKLQVQETNEPRKELEDK